jgi:lipoprotein-anchoring transpeptidase ErfK/SrfK
MVLSCRSRHVVSQWGFQVERKVMRTRVRGMTGLVALCALALSACGPGQDVSSAAKPSATPAPAATPAAQVEVVPADGTNSYRLDQPVKVTVTQGTIASVEVTAEKGTSLRGDVASDKTSWKSSGPLAPSTTYTVKVEAAAPDGKTATTSSSFTTLAPKHTASTWLQPSDGSTVGVGMPVIFNLSRGVDSDRRDAVEKGLSVTSEPSVEGAFRWFSSKQVQWRPKVYWPTGTKVRAESNLAGVQLDKGVWGSSKAASVDFTIGSSMISTVDVQKHTMTVRKNGSVLRVVPITTGKPGFASRNGVKVIMSRESERRMDAATTGTDPGDPEYYDIKVKYAMRLTYSGEFLHAAPWSVASQGKANVSHGCTGMSTANAKWMFGQSKMGDVVVFTGSKRPLEWGNGYTAWDMPYKTWKA